VKETVMKEEIRVIVEKDGQITIKPEGAHGSRCTTLTAFLEQGIGRVLARQRTQDFYRAARVLARNRVEEKNSR
jgi:hypothetical protein